MNSEHPEYNRDINPYPSFGKKYNSERGIISLTSWKARINTCSKTIYSLLKQCPGFHIVLVLSEEEFPKMMDELPENLKLFVDNELIEVLWVYKNYRSFKKVLFTMDKYREVPVISADDDCIYTCNYAKMLYDAWTNDKTSILANETHSDKYFTWASGGVGVIFPPSAFNTMGISYISNEDLIRTNHDDLFFGILSKKQNISFKKNPLCKNFKNVMIDTIQSTSGMGYKKEYSDKSEYTIMKILM